VDADGDAVFSFQNRVSLNMIRVPVRVDDELDLQGVLIHVSDDLVGFLSVLEAWVDYDDFFCFGAVGHITVC